MSKRIQTAVRIPAEAYEELQRQSDLRDVSINWLIVRAVTRYLNNPPNPEP